MYLLLDTSENLLLPEIESIEGRRAAEIVGGTLPVYVHREEDAVIGFGKKGELACFYCGFSKGGGHDYACPYVWWAHELHEQRHRGNCYIDVPAGGVKPSKSFF